MLNKIQTYLKFLFKSTNQHGVHSPFVYDFITKCLYNNNHLNSDNFKQINIFKASFKNNHNFITITDFGAGSKVFKSNTRKISAIAKNAGISKKRSELLYQITQHFEAKQILEIGTSLGIATASMVLANRNGVITTLEGCPETAKIAQNQFNKFSFKNINIEVGNFKNTLPKAIENKKYDLIYFDGNHQEQATINYFEQCLSTIHNESIFIFDDIHWSGGMETAWNYIKNHKRVTVSIDTYQWGIIFFRKEQPKEHFTIRV
ncbi:MAG: class I SAM-dependent methyltransferase [Flavobacteriaceae bacterium]|nr:class I SAM-dependent methyltransferase [Flavobacteriaceae bacterium]